MPINFVKLVEQGFNQAAFAKRENAIKFIRTWKRKGSKKCRIIRSHGPTVEKIIANAYYVLCEKPRKRKQ